MYMCCSGVSTNYANIISDNYIKCKRKALTIYENVLTTCNILK